jgi:predicted DNA-binding protein
LNDRFKNKIKTESLLIRIESELKKSLKTLAEKEGITVSEYVRTLILEEIERKKSF